MLSEDVWFKVVQKIHPLDAANMCTVSSSLYNNVVYPILSVSQHPVKLFKNGYSNWEDDMQFDVEYHRWDLAKSVDTTLGQLITSRRYFISLEPIIRNKLLVSDMRKSIMDLINGNFISPVYAVMEILTIITARHPFCNHRSSFILNIAEMVKSNTKEFDVITELHTANVCVVNARQTPKMMYALAMQGYNPFRFFGHDVIDYDKLRCFLITRGSIGPLSWCQTTGRGSPSTIQEYESAAKYMIHALMSGKENTMEWVWEHYMVDALKTCTVIQSRRLVDKLIECCGTHLLTSGLEFLSEKDALPDYFNCVLTKMVIQIAEKTNTFDSEIYAWLYASGMIPSNYNWRMDVEQNEGCNLIGSLLALLRWIKSMNKLPSEQTSFMFNIMMNVGLPLNGSMLRESEVGVLFAASLMDLGLHQEVIDALRNSRYL